MILSRGKRKKNTETECCRRNGGFKTKKIELKASSLDKLLIPTMNKCSNCKREINLRK